jgi:hypothetical protein
MIVGPYRAGLLVLGVGFVLAGLLPPIVLVVVSWLSLSYIAADTAQKYLFPDTGIGTLAVLLLAFLPAVLTVMTIITVAILVIFFT